jgi:hypothetical protein
MFIVLTIFAIVIYILDYKVPALVLLFFFLTTGFNLVPEEITQFFFISKGTDYALLILFGIIIIDSIFVKEYLKPDSFTKYLVLFGLFLFVCILYSKFVVGLGWVEIIRTCRYQFFWIAYFIFRNTDKARLEKLLKILFCVTVFCSALFILQIIIDETILIETVSGKASLFGIVVTRFYNQPDMLPFFAVMAIFCNPFKGVFKIGTSTILVLALMGAFHRSLTGLFIMTVALGFVCKLPRLRRIQVIVISSFLLLCGVVFVGAKFANSRTFVDLRTVMSGDIVGSNIDIDAMNDGTFTFRIAHLLERNQYLWDHPKAMLIGAGLMPEDSKKVENLFNFDIGLLAELTEQTVQVDTADISYSTMFIRLGYLGTFINLLLFIYLTIFFYKKKGNKYAISSFLFMVMSFGISFFSWNLTLTITYILPLISYHIVKKSEIENPEMNPTEKIALE